MAVDFTIASFMNRGSVIITEDAVIVLENDRNKDRMRKILLDRVESIQIWKKLPWGRMLFAGLFFGSFAPIFLSMPTRTTTASLWVGGVLIAVLLLIWTRYIYNRKTFIRIVQAGPENDNSRIKDFTLILRPGKIRRIVSKLCRAVIACQERGTAEAEKKESERSLARQRQFNDNSHAEHNSESSE